MVTINPIDVQKSLKGLNYPADKQEIVRTAADQGATDEIRAALDKLPDKSYETPADISKAIGDVK